MSVVLYAVLCYANRSNLKQEKSNDEAVENADPP